MWFFDVKLLKIKQGFNVMAEYKKYEIGDQDERDWGHYIVTDVEYDGDDCVRCEKDITVKPGFMLSIQAHDHRRENWKIVSGTLTVVMNGAIQNLQADQDIDIPQGAVHAMANTHSEPCVVHEIQQGICDENDNHRYWDANGRPVQESDDPNVVSSVEAGKSLLPQLAIAKSNAPS